MGGARGSSWELRPKGQQRLGVWRWVSVGKSLRQGSRVLPLATVPRDQFPPCQAGLCFSPNSQKGAARSLCKISNLIHPTTTPSHLTPTPPFGIRVLEGS